jgi:ABC-type transporter Mla maintaining outer membrane lipid asymmetry ATPase subunit MlaF
MSPTTVIELNGVDVLHEGGTEPLLRGVDWSIGEGEFWVVAGGPASGKTSLLATAAGMNRPGSGTLRIFGRALADATEEEQVEWRQRIGFVFENGGRLLHHLTIADNLALPLQYHLKLEQQELWKRVDQMLNRAELVAVAHATPSELSLVAQQRASLMRALAVPTDILMLDSPLRILSPRETRWWLEFIREQRAQREANRKPLTVVVASDDFRCWLEEATRFGVIENGRLRLLGSREEVKAAQEEAVRELV